MARVDEDAERLSAIIDGLSPASVNELLKLAEKLQKREAMAALARSGELRSRNFAGSKEMEYGDFEAFVKRLGMDQRFASRIWTALALKAGVVSGHRSDKRMLEIKAKRFTVDFIRKMAQRRTLTAGTHTSGEIFEVFEVWVRTL